MLREFLVQAVIERETKPVGLMSDFSGPHYGA